MQVLALALASTAASAGAPVHTPLEVRTSADRYVVVTLANRQLARPGAVGGTARGYAVGGSYQVSVTAAAVVKELSRAYGIAAVSQWPIEVLSMHCVLFRITSDASRDVVLEHLRADKHVLIAQPLNE